MEKGGGSSSLSGQIERAGSILQNGAVEQIEGYRTRFAAIQGLYERFFNQIIVDRFQTGRVRKTAKEVFGSEKVSFAAVDGTDYARPLFDLVVFFGGSYAARGAITYGEIGPPTVEYGTVF